MVALRVFVSLLFIVLLLIIALVIQNRTGDFVAMSLFMAGAPAVFLSTIASHDTKQTRFKVALKSLGITYLLYFIWQVVFSQLVRELVFGLEQSELMRAFMATEYITGFALMLLSIWLTIKWMPSWNITKPVISMPSEVEKAGKLLNFSIVAYIIFGIIQSIIYTPLDYATTENTFLYPEFVEDMVSIGMFAVLVFLIFLLYMVRESVNFRSYIWRNIILSFYLFALTITTISWLFDTEEMLRYIVSQSTLGILLTIILNIIFIIQCYAVYLLYTDQSKEWFRPTIKYEQI